MLQAFRSEICERLVLHAVTAGLTNNVIVTIFVNESGRCEARRLAGKMEGCARLEMAYYPQRFREYVKS